METTLVASNRKAEARYRMRITPSSLEGFEAQSFAIVKLGERFDRNFFSATFLRVQKNPEVWQQHTVVANDYNGLGLFPALLFYVARASEGSVRSSTNKGQMVHRGEVRSTDASVRWKAMEERGCARLSEAEDRWYVVLPTERQFDPAATEPKSVPPADV